MLNLGENIAFLRFLKKLSQEELAVRVNLSPQLIAEYEDGTKQPDTETLVKLAESTNVDIRRLIYRFPSIQEEKKQRRAFIALAALTIALGCFQASLQKFANEWTTMTFDPGLKIFLYALINPMFYIILGWAIVVGAKLFLELKTPKWRHIHKLHVAFKLLLLAYFIFAIPPTFNALWNTYAHYLASKQDLGFTSTPIPPLAGILVLCSHNTNI